jgi:hypothetical protein
MMGYPIGIALIAVAIVMTVLAWPKGGRKAAFFEKREWLEMIYPAAILACLAFGIIQIFAAATGR